MADFTLAINLDPIVQAARRRLVPDMSPLDEAVRNAALYVRDVWGRAVQGELLPGMTRAVNDDQYYEGLQTGEALKMYGPLHAAVISTYTGTQRIEQGEPAYDMKPMLLNGPHARMGKHGTYNVVPFRHMTPQASGKDRAHGAAMPKQVYQTVKHSGRFVDPASAAQGAQIGQRSKLAARINLTAVAAGQAGPMAGNYTWKAGQYTGMRKVVKTYGSGREQSTYWTWRAVSEHSDPSSWIHPGTAPNPVIESVIAFTRADVERMIVAGARAAYGVEE